MLDSDDNVVEGVAIGPNIISHALSCVHTARYVLREYGDNPGIHDGDMFVSNHPYISTPHQTCIVAVAPIHWKESIIAWAGARSPASRTSGATSRRRSSSGRSA